MSGTDGAPDSGGGEQVGYIGQMPQAPTALPGEQVTSGDKPEHTGARADELPHLLAPGTRSVSIQLPATTIDDDPAGASPPRP